MKTIEELLANLARPEVLEFALASDRLPCVKVGGSFQPVDGAAPSTDAILQMLVGVGGSRYVESLSTKPTQWTTRIDALGTVSISAIMRNDVVQARFTLTKREVARPSPVPPAPASSTKPTTSAKDASSKGDSKEVSALRRDPRRDQSNPPAALAASDEPDDDEPTLMTQPTGSPPSPPKPDDKEDLLDLEMDDTSPRAVAAPRPPAPLPLSAEDRTAELELSEMEPAPPSAHLRASQNGPGASRGPAVSPVAAPASLTKDTARHFQSSTLTGDSGSSAAPSSRGAPPTEHDREPPAPLARVPVGESRAATAPRGQQAKQASPAPPPAVEAMAPATAKPATKPGSSPPPARDDEPSVVEHARIVSAPGGGSAGALSELLALARALEASDLHIIAGRPALLRIAGTLGPRMNVLDAAAVERLAREAIPKRVAAFLDSEGACDFALEHPQHGRFRVNVTRQRTGLKACFRVIAREIPTLASLGLPEAIAAATHHHQGLILLTGPTGHGKTSTLAALVDLINRETSKHVITVEDPVEYLHPRKKAMMSQREVGTHTRSFAAALKGSLREDPDVIVVGELRDTETVRMALSAAETGHLVIGTMNTPSAAKTIDRLIDLFPPGDQQQVRMTLAGALRLIVSQRLLPNLERTRLVAAAEILPSSISLYTLIRDNKTFQIPSLQQRGKALGIVRLDDSLADLVRAGKSPFDDARLFAEAPDDFESLVGARPAARQETPKKKAAEETMDLGGLLSKAGSLFGSKKGG